MRHFVFAILIALLPLRSWAGDAMAIQMAAQATATASADHADCMEHAAMAAMTAQDLGHDQTPDIHNQDQRQGHCHTCAACQACSAVALALPETAMALPALPHSVPRWTAARYTSADRSLGQKPPIS